VTRCELGGNLKEGIMKKWHKTTASNVLAGKRFLLLLFFLLMTLFDVLIAKLI